MLEINRLQQIIESLILASDKALSEAQLISFFDDEERPTLSDFRQAIYQLQQSCEDRGFDLVQVASGYQFQVKSDNTKWVSRLWEEKPAKYSRALFETLALVSYRQPITRGEIEQIRGVSVSSSIFRTLDDRGWIRVVGHRDVPGKPALYATTKQFLDYFGLKSLDELPSLPEIMNLDDAKNLELEFEDNSNEEKSNLEVVAELGREDDLDFDGELEGEDELDYEDDLEREDELDYEDELNCEDELDYEDELDHEDELERV